MMGHNQSSSSKTTPVSDNDRTEKPGVESHVKPWTLATPRLFDLLAPAQHVLLAGCGGGYDVLSGLPLYFSLRAQGKQVTLANLSFTDIGATNAKTFCKGCYAVSSSLKLPSSGGAKTYFPELYLARWLKEKEGGTADVVVYTFDRDQGVKPLTSAYCQIVKQLNVDAIVLVDGGTDSIMFGTEEKLGTPVEDHSSMAAVSATPVPINVSRIVPAECSHFGTDWWILGLLLCVSVYKRRTAVHGGV